MKRRDPILESLQTEARAISELGCTRNRQADRGVLVMWMPRRQRVLTQLEADRARQQTYREMVARANLGARGCDTTSYQEQTCMSCGSGWGDIEVCCSDASYDDGTHDDAICTGCCGPHAPFNPQIQHFPIG